MWSSTVASLSCLKQSGRWYSTTDSGNGRNRDRYKALVEAHGGRSELLYFKAEPSVLRGRLAQRNMESGANALSVSDEMLEDFIARFDEPRGEGERVVGGADAG